MKKNHLKTGARARVYFAALVYQKRLKLKLSQQKLAQEIGSTQRVISNIEMGEVNVGLELVARLQKVLKFSAKEFSAIFSPLA